MEATDPAPVDMGRGQPSDTSSTPIYDDQPDRAAAEQMIADSRAEGWSGVTGEDETTPTPDPTKAEAETIQQFMDAPDRVRRRIDELSAPQPSRHVLSESVIARSVVPTPIVSPTRQPCESCRGTGYMPSISDYLRESASWIDDMDAVVRYFYTTMLDMARTDAEKDAHDAGHPDPLAVGQAAVDDLAFLFPPDLISAATGETDSRGAAQRDKLAEKLVGVATLYNPADAEAMERLDNVITSMAARHAAFARRDGTIKPTSLEEYALAKKALFATLVTLGPRFTGAHEAAWSAAYDFVAGGMMRAQPLSGSSFPRFPRA